MIRLSSCHVAQKNGGPITQFCSDEETKQQSIPSLKSGDGWLFDPSAKANLFASTWCAKSHLPPPGEEAIEIILNGSLMQSFIPLRPRLILKCMLLLDAKTSTGPDKISARFLKKMARAICVPFSFLCRRILSTGTWPDCWRVHHLVPIYKRGSTFEPGNYRGIHLTAILSKIAERVIGVPALAY